MALLTSFLSARESAELDNYVFTDQCRVAYTLLPQILLSIQTQLSTTPEDKQLHEVMLVFFTEVSRFLRSQYYMRLILAVSWKALELCRPSAPKPLPESSPESAKTTERPDLILSGPFFTDNVLYYYPNLFQLKLTEYIRLLKYVDEFMSLRRAPGEEIIYPSPSRRASTSIIQSHSQPLPRPHARTYSQASIPTSSSSSKCAVAAGPAADSLQDTSIIYPGDGDEQSDSPKSMEDYFWVYFGERELEGESPQTTNPGNGADADAETGVGVHGTGHDDETSLQYSGQTPGPGPGPATVNGDIESGKERSNPSCDGSKAHPPTDSTPATFQNMLDCLPLLGE